MSLRNLEHAVSESLVGIRRNGLMSIATVATIALSFGILGAFVFLTLGLNDATQSLLKDFEIGVFMKTDASEVDRAELSTKLRNLPNVTSVKLITREAAWEKMKADMGTRVELSGVETNPLPDQFCVKLSHPRHTTSAAEAMRELPHVDEVVEGRQVVEQVVTIADLVRLIGLISAGGLFLVTAFIISNTIRLTVYARRREIRIMQLVGATNWFIRLPLVLEGMLLGAVGGGLAYVVIAVSSRYITTAITERLPLLGKFSSSIDPLYFVTGMIALGCLVGATGSLISIRRFLKA